MRWFQRADEGSRGIRRLDLRVHFDDQPRGLARLMALITAREAIVTSFAAVGKAHQSGESESPVDIVLAVRNSAHAAMLIAEIREAGYSCEENAPDE